MRRMLVYIVLALVAFSVVLVAVLAYNNQLSRENIARLLGRVEPPVIEEAPDEVDALVQALDARQKSLDEREALLEKREEQLALRAQELDAELKELNATLAQINEAMTSLDAERQERVAQVAATYAAMEPQAAAEVLQQIPEEEAALFLSNIEDEDSRADILSEMDPKRVALITGLLARPNL